MAKAMLRTAEIREMAAGLREWADRLEATVPEVEAVSGCVAVSAGKTFGRLRTESNRLYLAITTAALKARVKQVSQPKRKRTRRK